ncbi:MAG: hypothetical protein M1530_04095 [Candidatus Marsarchaeota archaeon]|nr:hypothetical protein [Candidatus Marsarchaeota archaeon]
MSKTIFSGNANGQKQEKKGGKMNDRGIGAGTGTQTEGLLKNEPKLPLSPHKRGEKREMTEQEMRMNGILHRLFNGGDC